MTWRIRPFTEADYPAVAQIRSVCLEETVTEEALRWEDGVGKGKCRKARWVAEQEGAVVGYGQYSQSPAVYHPQQFDLSVMVLPEHRRRGIGSALYREVEAALAPFDPLVLYAGTGEEWPHGQRFLASRGFTERMRLWECQLDVQRFDAAPWQGLLAEVAAKGYEIRSLAELAGDPERDRKLHALVMEVRRDVPSPQPWQDVPFEEWIEVMRKNPRLFPEGYFVALHHGEWVGVSALWRSDDEGVLHVGLTAVKRAHRGTGIAKALKVRATTFAQEAGFKQIKTWNESNNERMLAINLKLGFVRKPGWIFYQKRVRVEG